MDLSYESLGSDPHFEEFLRLSEAYISMALLVQVEFDDAQAEERDIVLPSVAVVPLPEGLLRLRLDPPIYGVQTLNGKTLGDLCRQFADLILGGSDGTAGVETA